MAFEINNISVKRQISWRPESYPKSFIWDFEQGDASKQWTLEQSLRGILRFQAGGGVRHQNDDWKEETTDDVIDEDRNGSSYNFGASLGSKMITLRLFPTVGPSTPVNGASFPNPTRLATGANLFGNPPVANPEARHHSQRNFATNEYSGTTGSAFPYVVNIPRISHPVYKWEDQTYGVVINIISKFNGGTWDMGELNTAFGIFQKAVSITRNGATVIANNAQLTTTLSNALSLNKTLNRGHKNGSSWTIQKKDSLGNYVDATISLDYIFVTGTSTSDIIEIKFMVPGEFKVLNTTVGTSNAQTGPNQMVHSTFIIANLDNITVQIDDDITLPNIKANMVATPIFTNIVLDDEPILEGVEIFSVDITPSLDMQPAKWIQTTITSTNNSVTEVPVIKTNDLNEAQWLQLILDKALVKCVVIDSNTSTIIESRNCQDLGYNHTFRLPKGNYNCGYTIEPI